MNPIDRDLSTWGDVPGFIGIQLSLDARGYSLQLSPDTRGYSLQLSPDARRYSL